MLEIPKDKTALVKFLDSLPSEPGVYKFLSFKGEVNYIGKAKNIKKRVKSYFSDSKDKTEKIINLISATSVIDLTLTLTELEALLLEQRLIKEMRPKFNVQFKDDKGYPWIKIDYLSDFPAVKSFLGIKTKDAKFYGPFPGSYAVKDALNLIQKTFKLRNCSDSFFKNRTRPCMQFEIGRCSAPCVDYINKDDYQSDLSSATMVLQGKSSDLIEDYYQMMDKFSQKKNYERAGVYRDKISALRDIQRNQSISGYSSSRDAVVLKSYEGITKLGVTHVNEGWITGHENFTKKISSINESILESFIASHYFGDIYCPSFIVLDTKIEDKKLIENSLSDYHKKKVKIITQPNLKDKGLIEIAYSNTNLSLNRSIKKVKDISLSLELLQDFLKLDKKITRIDSFDISHHAGKNAVGGCVVYNRQGKLRDSYRLYNISDVNSGNDIASIEEVVRRRYSSKQNIINMPSLILVDGGPLQLKATKKILNDLEHKKIPVISISKGARRKSKFDSIHKTDGTIMRITQSSVPHLLLQEIRDETHRFSIANQRKKSSKNYISSSLDNIEGIGKNKKIALIRYFGSFDQVKRASKHDLEKVPGIGRQISNTLYNNLHNK
jgi:excinuclease ABC subunit C